MHYVLETTSRKTVQEGNRDSLDQVVIEVHGSGSMAKNNNNISYTKNEEWSANDKLKKSYSDILKQINLKLLAPVNVGSMLESEATT